MIIIRDKNGSVYELESNLANRGGALGKVFFVKNTDTKEKVVLKGVMPGATDEAALVIEIRSKIQGKENHLVQIIDPTINSPELSRSYPGYRFHIETTAKGRELKAIIEDEIQNKTISLSLSDRLKIALQATEVFQIVNRAGFAYLDHKPTDHYFWDDENKNLTIIDWNATRRYPTPADIALDLKSFFDTIHPVLNPLYVQRSSSVDIDYSLHPFAWSFSDDGDRRTSDVLPYSLWILIQQVSFRNELNLYLDWESFRADLLAIEAKREDIPSFAALKESSNGLPNYADAIKVVQDLVAISHQGAPNATALQNAQIFSRRMLRIASGFQPAGDNNIAVQLKAFVACWLARMLAPVSDAAYLCFELARLSMKYDSVGLRKLTAETIQKISIDDSIDRTMICENLEKSDLPYSEKNEVKRIVKIIRAYDLFNRAAAQAETEKIKLLSEAKDLDPGFPRYRFALERTIENKRISDDFNETFSEFDKESDLRNILKYEEKFKSFSLIDESDLQKQKQAFDRIQSAKKKQAVYQIYTEGMGLFSSSDIRKVCQTLRIQYSVSADDPDMRRLENRAVEIEKSEIYLENLRKMDDSALRNKLFSDLIKNEPFYSRILGFDELKNSIDSDIRKINIDEAISKINGISLPTSTNYCEAKKILSRFAELRSQNIVLDTDVLAQTVKVRDRIYDIQTYLSETIWAELGKNQNVQAEELLNGMSDVELTVSGNLMNQFPTIRAIGESVSARQWQAIVERINLLDQRLRYAPYYVGLGELAEIGLRIPKIRAGRDVEFLLERLDRLNKQPGRAEPGLCSSLSAELEVLIAAKPEIIEGLDFDQFPFVAAFLPKTKISLHENLSELHNLDKYRPQKWTSSMETALNGVRYENLENLSGNEQRFIQNLLYEFDLLQNQSQQQGALESKEIRLKNQNHRLSGRYIVSVILFSIIGLLLLSGVGYGILPLFSGRGAIDKNKVGSVTITPAIMVTDTQSAAAQPMEIAYRSIKMTSTPRPTQTPSPTSTDSPQVSLMFVNRLRMNDVMLFSVGMNSDNSPIRIGTFSGSGELEFLVLDKTALDQKEMVSILVKILVPDSTIQDDSDKLFPPAADKISIYDDSGKMSGQIERASEFIENYNYFLEGSSVANFYLENLNKIRLESGLTELATLPISDKKSLWLLGAVKGSDLAASGNEFKVSLTDLPKELKLDGSDSENERSGKNKNWQYITLWGDHQSEFTVYSDLEMTTEMLSLHLNGQAVFSDISIPVKSNLDESKNQEPEHTVIRIGVVGDQDLENLVPDQTQIFLVANTGESIGVFKTNQIPHENEVGCEDYFLPISNSDLKILCISGYIPKLPDS